MKKLLEFPIQVNIDNLCLKRKILKEKIQMFFQRDMPLTLSFKVHQRITFNLKLKSKMFSSKRKRAA